MRWIIEGARAALGVPGLVMVLEGVWVQCDISEICMLINQCVSLLKKKQKLI